MYIFFNTYALFYLIINKQTFSDFEEPATNINLIFISYLFVIIPFLFFCIYLYPYFQQKCNESKSFIIKISLQNKLTFFVLFLQVLFLIFNLITGVNSAGSTIKTDSYLKYLFIIFSPDIFFMILYATCRENNYFKYNLIIYLISNIQRGWMLGIFYILIFELYIYYKRFKFSKRLILILFFTISLIFTLMPYIIAIKWAARSYFGGLSSNFNEELELVINLSNQDYLISLFNSFSYLFGRFQVLTNVYLVFENMDILQTLKDNNEFISVFSIGLPQMFVHKIFGVNYLEINSFFPAFMTNKQNLDAIDWTTHVGWIGLIIPELYLFIFYLIYSILLVYIIVFLCNKIGGKYIFFLGWFATLIFLMHGWMQAYIGFLLNLISFYFVKNILKIFTRTKKCAE
jgi:hypothetical protein